MKIGRTNAVTISGGGGTTKSPYDEWQEGFNANWDSVVSNAPMTNTERILHIYTKVELLKMSSAFPTGAEIYTYNGSVYRQITMDANKRLAFVEADYITNTSDNLQYVCVVYGGNNLGTSALFVNLPVVYSNTKTYRQTTVDDTFANLLWQESKTVQFIRGIDCYKLQTISIHPTLEHLTYQTITNGITIFGIYGADNNVRLLKNIIDTKPPEVWLILNSYDRYDVKISDEKLADWFYNDLIYNNSSVERYVFPSTNNVKTFKFNPDFQIKMLGYTYLGGLPNAMYLTGTITENQTSTVNDGYHGFSNSNWTMLKNFPMWTVLEGASTGCLLPMNEHANVGFYLNGYFDFHSTNLEPKYFCEFDENGIIEDPTKYFICNLPFETIAHTNIQVRFRDLTFKNNFTAAQQSAISTYLTNKKWNLLW